MFANCQAGGSDACFPDVCKVPPGAPAPFPNVAMGLSALGFVPHVLFQCGPAHTLATTIPMTTGDEPGVLLGLVSQVIKGPARHTAGSMKLVIAGMPASRMTSPSTHNNNNALGARIAPSQTKLILLG